MDLWDLRTRNVTIFRLPADGVRTISGAAGPAAMHWLGDPSEYFLCIAYKVLHFWTLFSKPN